MSKLTTCKSCGKEVAKSAKKCPHCGEKLKMGFFMKLIIGAAVIGVISAIMAPSKDEKLKQLQEMASTQPANISPQGELAEMFSLGSKYTNLQREAKEKELKGQIVDWTLPVYEVKLLNKDSKTYKVQTTSQGGIVGTFVHIQALDDGDENVLSQLKTGTLVHFKGKISGVSIRNLEINPAVLVRNNPAFATKPANSTPATEQAPPAASEQAVSASAPAAPTPSATPVAVAPRTPTPSFDCAKASSKIEKLICSDADLADLDMALGDAYSARIKASTEGDKKALRESQKDWVKNVRNACQDVKCASDAYSDRLKVIQ